MPEQMPFIGRENELAQIEQLVQEWNTRCALCIHGEGGVGKTRLLEEIHSWYTSNEETRLLVADIIDFDDRTLHLPENVERRIAQRLGEKAFEPYLRGLLDWRKMKAAVVSPEELEQQGKRVRQAMMDSFNRISTERRVVLLLDTTEKLEGIEIWNHLTNLIIASKNALFLLAGRNARGLWESLQSHLGEDAKLIELQPLETKASQQYLEEKQRQLHTRRLKADLAQQLLLLAQGRPILIDLAVEWLSRDIPLDWLTTSNLEKIGALSETEMEKQRKDFEAQLVRRITQIRTPMDQLTLVMSRVYPLNIEMIIELLNASEEEARALFAEAQTYVFVKSLPHGRISLHDEMRRMVREYVWPEIDPDGDRQRRDSRLAVKYFEHQIQTLTQDIRRLAAEEETSRREKNAQVELDAFMAREASERELWALREQQLFHTLFTDVEAGVKTFVEIFDEATHAYHFSFREVLLGQMQKQVDRLSPEQKFEVDIRQAKYLLDSGQYPKAKKLLVEISGRTGLRPDQQIDTFIQLANVEIRLGKFQDGIKFFKEAVQISQEYGLKAWLAKAETGLGWAYRLTADLKKAGEHYEIALDLAMEIESKHQQALLYNNLGFVYAYYAHIPGSRDKALWFCNQSLSLWEELDDKRGKGRSYSTLGCITFMAGRFDEALSHFQKALNIFEPAHDREWLSIVYSWRGAVHMSKGNFELAEKDLLQSLEMNIQKDRPINLSRLGQLYIIQGRLDEAHKAIDECRELALALPDIWYQLVSLRDTTRLAFRQKEYERLEEFEQLLADYLEKWEAQDLRALGMLYLNLGQLALGKSDLASAVEHFKLGLELLAQLGRYGNDTPQAHIERLEKAMVTDLHLSPEQIRDIGSKLLSFWQEERLDVIHPDVRILLSKWAKWEGA